MAMRKKSLFPPPSISGIAAAVPKSPMLVDLESRLSALREKRDDVYEQFRTLTGSVTPDNKHGIDAILRAVSMEKAAVDTDIVAVRLQHSEARQEHLAAVRAALEPRRTIAEVGVRTSYEQLILNWRELDAIAAELRAAGGAGAAKEHANARQVELFVRRMIFGAVGDHEGLREAGNRAA